MPQGTNENATALAAVVILNWFISHLATSWVMPPEVQSSLQSIIQFTYGSWLQGRAQRAQEAKDAATRALAAGDPRVSTTTEVKP